MNKNQERAEERPEGVGTSSWLPGVAATSGNNETMICDGEQCLLLLGRQITALTDGQKSVREFVTQEAGTPEACNHSFCADCLQ
jgi:hypothetical protein